MFRPERRENDHLLPGTGDSHVEPPPAALAVERTKVHGNVSVFVRSVAHGKQNDVALVALYVLQIFDEQRFFALVRPAFERLVCPARFFEQIGDQILLMDVERHHADALSGAQRIMAAAGKLLHDGPGLRCVLPCPAAVKEALNRHERDL